MIAAVSDVRASHGKASQLNLQGNVTAGKIFHWGTAFDTLEAGAKVRNEHKFDDSYQTNLAPFGTVLMTQFINGFKNNNYYDGSYPYGPTASWEAVNQYIKSNPAAFGPDPNNPDTAPPVLGGNPNNFDLVERVSAGYLQNTLAAGRLTFIAGLRVEGTQVNTTSFDSVAGTLSLKGSNSYVDLLPSASLLFSLGNNSDLRLVYSRALSRPDPQFLTTATSLDSSTVPPTLTIGNPALKPEHGNNFDILYSHYLKPIGAIQGGFFYKRLTDPIVQLLSMPTTGPNVGFQVVQAANSGSAYIAGVEINFQQHFTYLPGLLSGLGLSTNYSYTTSQATNVNPGNRTDKPALLRQAPNTLNVSPTYDRGRLSMRVGFAYNGANIFLYNYVDGNPGGIKGAQRRPVSVLPRPDRCSGKLSSRSRLPCHRLRAQLEQRGIRLLSGKPAVLHPARILQTHLQFRDSLESQVGVIGFSKIGTVHCRIFRRNPAAPASLSARAVLLRALA
jgi:TonB-dependent receptor